MICLLHHTLMMCIGKFKLFMAWNLYLILFILIWFLLLFLWFYQVTFVMFHWMNVINVWMGRIMIFQTNKLSYFALFKVWFDWAFHIQIYFLWVLKFIFRAQPLLNEIIMVLSYKIKLLISFDNFFGSQWNNTMFFIRMF